MKSIRIIKKWAKLRHPDKKFATTAIAFYKGLNERDRIAMVKEFQEYIDGVRDGTIIPGPIELSQPPKINV